MASTANEGTAATSGTPVPAQAPVDWGVGQYEQVAATLIPAAEELVTASGIRPGERVHHPHASPHVGRVHLDLGDRQSRAVVGVAIDELGDVELLGKRPSRRLAATKAPAPPLRPALDCDCRLTWFSTCQSARTNARPTPASRAPSAHARSTRPLDRIGPSGRMRRRSSLWSASTNPMAVVVSSTASHLCSSSRTTLTRTSAWRARASASWIAIGWKARGHLPSGRIRRHGRAPHTIHDRNPRL